MTIDISPQANLIIKTLEAHGYEAFAVGGCVRNAMLGLVPHDWDICTNARPEEMLRVFSGFETHGFGLKHGTLVVIVDGQPYEVTTYRIDGEYSDNRHPEQVTFTDSLTLDLSRRDFTVNAMAYSAARGLIDPFGGSADLAAGVLRCVGTPGDRFNEDALRILRGLRFASVYGFAIEENTAAAIHANAALLKNIAGERIREELFGMLCGKNAGAVLAGCRDVIAEVIPELRETFDFPQKTKHHKYDVWGHIVSTVSAIKPEPLLRVTMLLHDIGKPRACTTDAYGCNHFKGHQKISAEMAELILKRLRCPNAFSQAALQLIEYHDVRFDGSPKQLKRLLRVLGEERLRELFLVQRADISGQSDYFREEKLAALSKAERQLDDIIAQNECFSLKDLAVNGNDLRSVGIAEGRRIGEILNALLDIVISGESPNEKEALLVLARHLYK